MNKKKDETNEQLDEKMLDLKIKYMVESIEHHEVIENLQTEIKNLEAENKERNKELKNYLRLIGNYLRLLIKHKNTIESLEIQLREKNKEIKRLQGKCS